MSLTERGTDVVVFYDVLFSAEISWAKSSEEFHDCQGVLFLMCLYSIMSAFLKLLSKGIQCLVISILDKFLSQ